MKTIGAIFLLLFIFNIAAAQSAYLQVSGEAGLQVYINDQFKCTTTTELGGCIIENIRAGIITVKVVKSGYVPYEEKVTIKPGEVLLYKVKPFSKNKVFVSESGNTEVADTKKVIETGTLIVQSLPINILITILEIDDIDDKEKTKDIWKAENISTGLKTLIFEYNGKIIEKEVEILDKRNTQVFVNMLNGEVKVTNSIEEKHRVAYRKELMEDMAKRFRYKPGLSLEEFISFNPEARNLIPYRTSKGASVYSMAPPAGRRNGQTFPFLYEMMTYYKKIDAYYVVFSSKNYQEASAYFERLLAELTEKFEETYIDKRFIEWDFTGNRSFFTNFGSSFHSSLGYKVSIYQKKWSNGTHEVIYGFINY